MKKRLVLTLSVVGLSLATMPAFAQPTQAGNASEVVAGELVAPDAAVEIAQVAEYVDANDNTITLVTFVDGRVAVSINNGPLLSGTAAVSALRDAGIALSVSATGAVTVQSVAPGVTVVQAPVAMNEAPDSMADAIKSVAEGVSSAPTTNPLPPVSSVGSGASDAQLSAQELFRPRPPVDASPSSR